VDDDDPRAGADVLLEEGCDRPRDDVGAAAGRIGHDQGERLLGVRGAGGAGQQRERGEDDPGEASHGEDLNGYDAPTPRYMAVSCVSARSRAGVPSNTTVPWSMTYTRS